MDIRLTLPDGTTLTAVADVNTDVRRENTDVRCVGFLPPKKYVHKKFYSIDPCFEGGCPLPGRDRRKRSRRPAFEPRARRT
jgi:hypothetical protein